MSEGILTVLGAADLVGPQEGVGFWHRFLARVIDLVFHYWSLLVAGLLGGVLAGVVAAAQGISHEALLARVTANDTITNAAALAGFVLLTLFSEAWHGSSIGKRICGIAVVSESGETAGMAAALKRGLALYVDSLFFGLVAAGNMGRTPRKQRLGDRWAKTMVVKLSSLPPSEKRSWMRFVLGAALGVMLDGSLIFASFVLAMLVA